MKSEIHLLMMWNNSIKFLIFLLLFFSLASASGDIIPEKRLSYDSSSVSVRKIPEEALRKLYADDDYNYVRTTTSTSKTVWERFKDWFWEKVIGLFNSKTGSITIRIIKYIVVAAAIFFIVFLLLKNDARSLFYRKGAAVSVDFMESVDDIQEIDFDKRIAEEVARRDFRKAVRLYFLKIIKELNQHHLINWKQDKTNTDYLKELRNGSYYQQFAELSKLYEYIWYGDFRLDEANFLTVIQKFNQFKIAAQD